LEPVPGEIIKRGKHDKHGHGGRSIVMFVKEADQIADLVLFLFYYSDLKIILEINFLLHSHCNIYGK
jgi:hypothetical protein